MLSLGLLVACGLGWLGTNELPSGLRVDPLGPAYYPRFVLLGLAALSAALLVASVRDLRRQPVHAEPAPTDPLPAQAVGMNVTALGEAGLTPVAEADEEVLPPISYPRMLAVFGLSVVYVLLLTTLGYLISTVLYVVVLLVVLRVRSPLAIAACAIGVPLVLGSLFGWLLGIPLPRGPLEPFSDVLPF